MKRAHKKLLEETNQPLVGDIIGWEGHQDLIDYCVAHGNGMDAEQAQAIIEDVLNYTEWQARAAEHIHGRIAALADERGARDDQLCSEVLSDEEISAIINEEWSRARGAAPGLN